MSELVNEQIADGIAIDNEIQKHFLEQARSQKVLGQISYLLGIISLAGGILLGLKFGFEDPTIPQALVAGVLIGGGVIVVVYGPGGSRTGSKKPSREFPPAKEADDDEDDKRE